MGYSLPLPQPIQPLSYKLLVKRVPSVRYILKIPGGLLGLETVKVRLYLFTFRSVYRKL